MSRNDIICLGGVFVTTGENIKMYRNKLSLTQKQLAEKSRLSESAIKYYESGIRNPKIKTLTDISIALNVRLVDLLEGNEVVKSLVGNETAQIASTLWPYTGDDNSWVLRNLDPKQKEAYMQISQQYLDSNRRMSKEDKKIMLLTEFVQIIAEGFIELPKDNLEDISAPIALWLKDYAEMAVTSKIDEYIKKSENPLPNKD